MPLATVLHQEPHKLANRFIAGTVDKPSSFAAAVDQACMSQRTQVKRKCCRREAELAANLTRWQTLSTFPDQQSKHAKPALLG